MRHNLHKLWHVLDFECIDPEFVGWKFNCFYLLTLTLFLLGARYAYTRCSDKEPYKFETVKSILHVVS